MSDTTSLPADVLTARTLAALKQARARIDALERVRTEPVAIIGIGCRYPGGVCGPESFWELVSSGRDAISRVPGDRWDADALYDRDPKARGRICTREGGFLDQVDQFDSWFFGISPKEAAGMDPQQRVFLEVCWEALEHAGQAGSVYGSRTGVFAGVCSFDYAGLKFAANRPNTIDPYFATGNATCAVSGRTSYVLGLKGPSLSIDTACSSSLVSIHFACQSLRTRECDMALAGGVNLLLTPELSICFSQAGMLSPDGRCRTFDARANGYVRSEGCGVLVLKRLQDAIAAGDNVMAVIRGSAVNQDGPSGGLTVPSGPAQEEVVRLALAAARLSAEDISYIEAHGTGTSLGDPIEVNALASALCETRRRENPLLLGSVKTNIGHAEGAAGVAGVIKVALALANGGIPPHLHFETPNPHVNWQQLPVEVVSTLRAWPADRKRIAGVSAFGATGTNAHVIVGEAPTADHAAAEPAGRSTQLLMISAKTPRALAELATRHETHLRSHSSEDLPDVCYSASVGRAHFRHRLAVSGASGVEMQERLQAFQRGEAVAGLVTGEAGAADVTFVFSGQGSQFAGMGRSLYQSEPVFREALDRCDAILSRHLDRSIVAVMFAEGGDGLIDQTLYTQPALFAFEYALSELWRTWGVRPAAVMGHSVGEYTAACLAGVFSLEDGLGLIAARARLMQQTPVGAMAAVFCTEQQAAEAIAPYRQQLSSAAVNGPMLVVISGAASAVDRAVATLEAAGVMSQRLQVSRAFHSPLMDGMMEAFQREAEKVTYAVPSIGLVSNVTGRLERAEVANAKYWVDHIRRPVMFAAGVKALYDHGHRLFLEIGPKPTLVGMGRRCLPDNSGTEWLASLRPERDERDQLLESLGHLYVRGASNGETAHLAGRRKLALPTYPFERKRYWFSDGEPASIQQHAAPSKLPGRRLRLPHSAEVRFECEFSQTHPAYIEDHRLFGELVVAGASHLSTLLLAAKEIVRTDRLQMTSVLLQQPMVIADGGRVATQIILTPDGNGGHAAKLVSGGPDDEDANWKLHVSATMTASSDLDAAGDVPADALARLASMPESARILSGPDVYDRVAALGHHLGSSFQWIEDVWRDGSDIVARLAAPALPAESTINFDDYIYYPGLIDSCIQPFCIFGPEIAWGDRSSGTPDDPIYIPFSIGRLIAHERASVAGPMWTRTRFHSSADRSSLTGDVLLFDDQGRLLLELREFRARMLSREVLERVASAPDSARNALYELVWSRAEQTHAGDATGIAATSWLILADAHGVGRRLAALLEARGMQCVIVQAAAGGEADADLARVTRALANGEKFAGVVHLWGLDSSLDGPAEMQQRAAGSALRLLQMLAALPADKRPAGTWLVSAGAVSPARDFPIANPQQAALFGLGRVVNIEQPDLRAVNVDIGETGSDADLRSLCDELLQPTRDEQLAFRHGLRYVPRLTATPPRAPGVSAPTVAPTKVKISEYGILDNLTSVPMERRAPGPTEVEISVRATGLNFRDVLRALGMLKDFEAALGYGSSAEMTFGFECSGTVVRAGAAVTDLRVGDNVVAALTFDGSLASYLTIDAAFVFAMSERLSFEDAATLPLAYLTAEYGLRRLCDISRGDVVLIHAAAGGVGLAAVQIAQAAGAEIFATASPSKWAYLHSLGIDKVMNSRTTDFADEVMRLTEGRGVDIVLNSLNGQFTPKTLACLRHGGRFVEIGKIGIWTSEQMAAARPDVTYLPFDLWNVAEKEPDLIRSMFEAITRDLETGTLQPLHHEVFPVSEVVAAFRHMAQARHIGKIVVTQPAVPAGPVGIRQDATYLVTGGLGALGLRVADWLVNEGARAIVLTGRRDATGEAADAVEALRRKGSQIDVVPADLARRQDVERLLSHINGLSTPLRGVFHAAGVIEDAALAQQTISGLHQVMAPKVRGTWHLHQATSGAKLDHFVLFSSAASMLGSAGQANYAAANAFMDALATMRRSMGLPGLSICWGPWEGAGMAATLDARWRQRLATRGIGTITPDRGIATLADLLNSDAAVVGVLPIDWARYVAKVHQGRAPRFIADLAPATAVPSSPAASPERARPQKDFAARLAAAPSNDRRRMLAAHVRAQIAGVMGLESGSQIEARQRLFDIGIDSLMAVELRNSLHNSLAISLPTTLVFDYPTVEAMVDFLAAALRVDEASTGPLVADAANTLADLARASADELAAMLERELTPRTERPQ